MYFTLDNQAKFTEIINNLTVEESIPFREYLENSGTTAFIIIHGNELIYENYFNGFGHEDTLTTFSISKSFLSTLVGIAITEGYINSIDDVITSYIPELRERDAKFSEITIRHLLTMSSGIKYQNYFSPWSDPSKTYYAPDLRDTALNCEILEVPGQRFLYNNYNPLLIGLVLESATGIPVAEYMETRLWQPMGAESGGSWSLDSTRSGFEKMESGINGKAIDIAKLGWLFINNGRNGDVQVVPREWIEEATKRDDTNDPALFYQYFWWVDNEIEAYWAEGNFGQGLYIYPEQQLVLLRMGKESGNTTWTPDFLRSLAQWLEINFNEIQAPPE